MNRNQIDQSGRHRGIPARSTSTAHARLGGQLRAVPDGQVPGKADLVTHAHDAGDLRAAGQADLGGKRTAFPDRTAMGGQHQIVYIGTTANDGGANGRHGGAA